MQKKTELLFFIPYFLYLFCRLIDTSTFQAIFDPTDTLNWPVRILSIILIGVKLILEFKDWKKYAYAYITIFTVFLLAAYVSKRAILLDMFILIIGAWNIDFKKILKIFVYTATLSYIAFFIWSILGVIPDATFWGDNLIIVKFRHSLGAISPTDFGAMIFYLQISWAFYRKKAYSIKEFFVWIMLDIFIYIFCHSRLDVVLIVLFAIVWLLKDKCNLLIQKSKILYYLSIPICFVVSLVLHIFYNNSRFMLFINSLLSDRLAYGKIALDKYGLTLFGSDFDMYGIGWSLEPTGEYNFVDCGYLYIGIQYGVLVLLVILVGYLIIVNKEIKASRYELPIIISFIALSSVVDHHIFQVAYNPFIFLLPVAISYYPFDWNTIKSHFLSSKVEEL